MSVAVELVKVVASVGGLLAAMAAVRWLADRYGWSAEVQRKCVHVATGLFAVFLPLIFAQAWPVLLLAVTAIVVMGVLRLPAFAGSRIGSTIHSVERQSYGEIMLAVAIGFTFFRSLGEPVLYVLPILVLTFSDAAAALTGVRYGSRRFTVEEGTKSAEGVVMFFLVTFIIAMVTLLLMTDVSRERVILLSAMVAAFGALIEAQSWRGFDNLFVPVGLHLFLQNNIAVPPQGLAFEAALFLGLIAGLYYFAPALGLSRHTATAYGVLAFLILSVTAPWNAVLPLAAFVAYIHLRRQHPCASRHPDLDFLAAMAGVAAIWLFSGEYFGLNTINLYNLTFAGAAAALVVLAEPSRRILSVVMALLLAALVLVIVPLQSGEALWVRPFAPWVAASIALTSLVATLWPAAFERYRAPRLFALAMLVPVILLLSPKGLTS